ncbi:MULTISPECIES: hypothetical protein [unclassified Paenibacillus]|uniref:hypothetical protein n=1 Tax=unclassified Paenibacillus TaxID=185978 RepID=UPI0027815538|nr:MULTISPECIES: hypothetical protein [unclassified Paenibacillus]MDQ0901999.1 ABC-type multidrug transport system permease subunit [Paenibacillus sp. V4I7]MDQ0919504.1 ABC-type multidrug transport system permease subunit [Paenibacillus sp. V4I5]
MSQRKTLRLLISMQVVYVLFIVVWLFVSAIAMMGVYENMFEELKTWLFLAYLLSYPSSVLAALIAGWVLYKRKKYGAALLWNVYPLLWILSLIGIFTFVEFFGG